MCGPKAIQNRLASSRPQAHRWSGRADSTQNRSPRVQSRVSRTCGVVGRELGRRATTRGGPRRGSSGRSASSGPAGPRGRPSRPWPAPSGRARRRAARRDHQGRRRREPRPPPGGRRRRLATPGRRGGVAPRLGQDPLEQGPGVDPLGVPVEVRADQPLDLEVRSAIRAHSSGGPPGTGRAGRPGPCGPGGRAPRRCSG